MSDSNFVPKVHPLDRPVDVDDPLELMAQTVVGDPEVMLESVLQEFIWLGWGQEQLLALFSDPAYPLLVQLADYYGPEEIERRVRALLAQTGQLRFREVIAEDEEEADDHGPELLQIRPHPDHHVCR